ncbi:hypothetical protein [Mesorhizobium sp. M0488]
MAEGGQPCGPASDDQDIFGVGDQSTVLVSLLVWPISGERFGSCDVPA